MVVLSFPGSVKMSKRVIKRARGGSKGGGIFPYTKYIKSKKYYLYISHIRINNSLEEDC